MEAKKLESRRHALSDCVFRSCFCKRRFAAKFQRISQSLGRTNLGALSSAPGISVTVEYGSDHLACQIIVEPPQEEQTQLMSSKDVSEILEEVAPVASRGNAISRRQNSESCRVGYLTDYENVSIMRGMSECKSSSPDHDSRTQIIFKRDSCPKTNNPIGVTQLKSR